VLFHLDGPYLVDEYIPFFATALQFNTDW